VAYVKTLLSVVQHDAPLFPTQKRTAFSANSLCLAVNVIYARAQG
jgi:hypothetical protein